MRTETEAATIYQRPAELLRRLIRFDTTNPPGNEAACIAYLADLLREAGIESTILARDPNRPNLVARLTGRGDAPPLLLYGHVDVVTTADQEWTHPPFAAEIADGYIWGRGALDMKGGVAMLVAAFLRAKVEAASLPGDVVLAIVSDEEHSGTFGARYLVEEQAHRFEGIRFALGEFGGFTSHIGNRAFYPIMVAEKQWCQVRATVRGPAGHGAFPLHGGATAKMGRLLTTLDHQRLPVHITPGVRLMISSIAAALPFPSNLVLRQLLRPALTDRALALLGAQGDSFDPLLHNTVNVTMLQGGAKNNVIPSKIEVNLDARLLPGFDAEDVLRELRALAGPDVAFEALDAQTSPAAAPDMGLFATLADILRAADPAGIPIPYVLAAVTDGRYFSRLGIQTYGFLPMKLPKGWNFPALIHAADERIPVDAVAFGANAIYTALQRFGDATVHR